MHVRVQKERSLSDAFGCDLADGEVSLDMALKQVSQGDGIVLYIRDSSSNYLSADLVARGSTKHVEQSGRGPGMDLRDYGIGAQILRRCGVRQMRLVTTSERNISALSGFGLELIERVNPLTSGQN